VTPPRPEAAGIIFDDLGMPWPAQAGQLAPRPGAGADRSQTLTNAVRNLGFVHVEPLSDVLWVTFEPTAVSRLAAVAAFYEISAHAAARRLVIAYPATADRPERCEVFDDVREGLKRLDDAVHRIGDSGRPRWLQSPPVDRRRAEQRHRLRPGKPLPSAALSGADEPGTAAHDHSVRLSRPLAAISPEDEWLGQLLGFWGNARRGRRLPSDQSLDALQLLNIARGRAHIVDTAGSNPAGYRFRLWGAVNSYGGGYANRALGEMPAGPMRDEAMADYRRVVAAGAPSYHLISLVDNNRAYSYTRLLLPLGQDGRRVDRLVVLINERRLPELGKA
jgi:hypothetical protein